MKIRNSVLFAVVLASTVGIATTVSALTPGPVPPVAASVSASQAVTQNIALPAISGSDVCANGFSLGVPGAGGVGFLFHNKKCRQFEQLGELFKSKVITAAEYRASALKLIGISFKK